MKYSLGQHLLVGLSGTELETEERAVFRDLSPIGTIIFAHNVDKNSPQWPEKLRKLIHDVKEASGRQDFLVSIDHEGDRVHRLPLPATRFPAARQWSSRTAEVASAMAKELRSLDINLSYAPVLDIHSEPANTVIGVRAFSTEAAEVIAHGKNFLTALEGEGVLGCGKHFPGHGSTVADSHHQLPVSSKSKAELAACELKPFQALIDAGIGMIMTAHVIYPALDETNPATVSKKIIAGLLRREMKFKGVVISDALEMGALSSLTAEEVAVQALQASVDILLVGQRQHESTTAKAQRMHDALQRALEDGRLQLKELQESSSRLNELNSRLRLIQANIKTDSRDLASLGEAHTALCEACSVGNTKS